MSKEELMQLRVVDLREALTARGLPKWGNKEKLVRRLMESTSGKAAGAGGPKVAEADSSEDKLGEELVRLRAEMRKREEALQRLEAKFAAAERAQTVDRALLEEMRASIQESQAERQAWRESLRSGTVEKLRASVESVERRLRPELERQLAELESLVEGLENETSLKEDVLRQLTASLNRSLQAPSSGKFTGSLGPLASEDPAGASGPPAPSGGAPPSPPPGEGEGAAGRADARAGETAASAAGAETGEVNGAGESAAAAEDGRQRKGKAGLNGIGVALAAGVIAVLQGLSLGQVTKRKPPPQPPAREQDGRAKP